MVKITQIWEDKDKRRAGRTFKIQNIDPKENKATVEILTAAGGKKPDKNNEISFIRLDRFNSKKYYKLIQDVVSVFVSEPDLQKPKKKEEKITVFQDTARGCREMETVIVRRKAKNEKQLTELCQEHWPGEWQKSGPFSLLTSDRFEVMVRKNFSQMFDIKVKLDKFCIYNIVSDKPLDDTLMRTRTALAKIAENLIDMVLPDECEKDML